MFGMTEDPSLLARRPDWKAEIRAGIWWQQFTPQFLFPRLISRSVSVPHNRRHRTRTAVGKHQFISMVHPPTGFQILG